MPHIDGCRAAMVFGIALVVGSCGGAASPAGSAAPAATRALVSQPAATMPAVPAATEAPAAGLHSAPDLEAMLPDRVGGVELQKLSFGGTSFAFDAGAPFDSSALDPFLKANGKTIADVRLAIARPVDAVNGALATTILALQVKGIDAAQLSNASGGSLGPATATVIGGKQVLQTGTTFTYFKDDIAFTLLLPNPGDAAEVLSALP